MDIHLLAVPYDSAQRGARMGAGPEHLLATGFAERLAERGQRVHTTIIEPRNGAGWRAEIRTAFDLAAAVAAEVRAARDARAFPLVLAGNCFAALGVVAGLGAGTGVLWFDAHGDFNTPETTTGGFLDGMALAALTGRCWTALSRRVPGFAPVPEGHAWLLGARDLDPEEADALAHSAILRVPPDEIGSELGALVFRELRGPTQRYLHLDLDVLDPSEGRVNGYAAPGGVSLDALAAAFHSLGEHAPPAALTLSAYDPSYDADGRVGAAAFRLADALLAPALERRRGATR